VRSAAASSTDRVADPSARSSTAWESSIVEGTALRFGQLDRLGPERREQVGERDERHRRLGLGRRAAQHQQPGVTRSRGQRIEDGRLADARRPFEQHAPRRHQGLPRPVEYGVAPDQRRAHDQNDQVEGGMNIIIPAGWPNR
jgi:hypothetical protein